MDFDNVINMKRAGGFKLKPKHILAGVIALIAVLMAFSCVYTVSESQRAVVTTFDVATSVKSAGLNFKLPYPLQKVYKVDMKTRKLTIGYIEQDNGTVASLESESKMITGDMNIINIDFFIEYVVTDPVKFLFKSDRPVDVLKNIAQSSARSVVGGTKVDDALTTGKSAIQSAVKELINAKLDEYDIGVSVIDVKIQDSEPPTEEVKAAFKNVENAKQTMETQVNEAKQYRNKMLPDAQSQADKIIRDAEAKKEARINEAKGQVARFNEMYAEYAKYKEVTRTRMYLEALEEILPGIEVFIESGSGGTQKILPIKSFIEESKGGAAE